VITSRIRILDNFFTSLTIAEWGIFGDLLTFLIQSSADFTIVSEMANADKVMNPLHFGSDPADIQIRIRINPEIQIWVQDHFGWDFVLGRGLLCDNCRIQSEHNSYYGIYAKKVFLKFNGVIVGVIGPNRGIQHLGSRSQQQSWSRQKADGA